MNRSDQSEDILGDLLKVAEATNKPAKSQPPLKPATCPDCKGKGHIPSWSNGGHGKPDGSLKCFNCKGTGKLTESQSTEAEQARQEEERLKEKKRQQEAQAQRKITERSGILTPTQKAKYNYRPVSEVTSVASYYMLPDGGVIGGTNAKGWNMDHFYMAKDTLKVTDSPKLFCQAYGAIRLIPQGFEMHAGPTDAQLRAIAYLARNVFQGGLLYWKYTDGHTKFDGKGTLSDFKRQLDAAL